MLSYQHGYHAGNFADVIKHTTLSLLLTYLTQKDKPLFYLETHSGRGFYDLSDNQATKTKEFEQGISLLWAKRKALPEAFLPYMQGIEKVNPGERLRYYPGSPAIAIEHLRDCDRLFCCELHPKEFEHLNTLPTQNKRVFFSETDGIHALKAQLPPNERRGLIFIDPAYEIKSEYKQIPLAIKSAFTHFSGGVFCLWYPLVDKYLHQQLLRHLASIPSTNQLRLEFHWATQAAFGMTGCGLWIINPPYTLATEMKVALQYLRTLFNPGISTFLIEG